MEYDGPFEVFERLRLFTRKYRGINLDCFFCLSVWIALPFGFYFASGTRGIIYWFGLAGAATVINEVLGND